MEPKVLYEDEVVLVVDKPAGMVVNRAQTAIGETLQDWVEQKLRFNNKDLGIDLGSDFTKRSGVVHRLDKETSGVLIVAKTAEAFDQLQQQFRQREIEKIYLALVHGKVQEEEGIITAPVGRLPWNRQRFGVLAGGRAAETKYKTIDKYKLTTNNESFTLLELYPKTGRTHQIRVHLKSIGHPIVGDTFYAGRKTARQDRLWCRRLFLHATSISFTHPLSGKRVVVTSPLSADLAGALRQLDRTQ